MGLSALQIIKIKLQIAANRRFYRHRRGFGGLLVLVPQVTTGTSTFNLTVSDGVRTNGGDITVVVQPKE